MDPEHSLMANKNTSYPCVDELTVIKVEVERSEDDPEEDALNPEEIKTKRFTDREDIKQEPLQEDLEGDGLGIKKEPLDVKFVEIEIMMSEEYLKEDKAADNIEMKASKSAAFTETFSLTQRPFQCEICQRRFTQKICLNKHIRIHTGEKPFQCKMCQRSFSQKYSLDRHLKTHIREEPFQNETCQQRCSEKNCFNNHLKTHTGKKPFQCDVCKHRFSVKNCLITHLKIHTTDKSFKCEMCKQRFTRRNSLNRHLRIHTGEKLFKCEICQRRFTQKGAMNRHLKTHNSDKII